MPESQNSPTSFKTIRIIRQHPATNTCGQACVAMVCGITLEEACMLTRTKGKTTTAHLKRALHAMGVEHDERRTLGHPPKDTTALLYWRSNVLTSRTHWTVWHKNKHYDPLCGVFRKTPEWLRLNARVTSHLRVYL